jgi:hypothetical protein
MNEEAKAAQGFMDDLRSIIGRTYEMAVSLDRIVVDKREKYFGVACTDVKGEAIPDNMSGEMFALLNRTMEIIERAQKYVLEV